MYGRARVVNIATRYGLEGPGVESRCGRDLSHPSRPTHPASCTKSTGVSFPWIKRLMRGLNHSSSAEVKERVELYLYSPSGTTLPATEWILPSLFSWLPVDGRCHVFKLNLQPLSRSPLQAHYLHTPQPRSLKSQTGLSFQYFHLFYRTLNESLPFNTILL
jgi:hypothetical protein